MTQIGEICDRSVVVAYEHETVQDAALRMRAQHVGSVVIVRDAAVGRVPVGIVTDRDIVTELVAAIPGRAATMTLGELGYGALHTAREDEDFFEVLARLRALGLRRCPIVDGQGRLQGIVSFDDLVLFLSEQVSHLAGLLKRGQQRERETLGPSNASVRSLLRRRA